MNQLPEALAPLAAYDQFILYKLVPSKTTPDKIDKLPVDYRTLQVFKKEANWQQNPSTWTTADNALLIANMCGPEYGVGFFFTTSDPFFFVDIDKCLQADGTWSPVAMDIIARLPGAAIEVSQSGTGLHIFGMGNTPEHGCKNIPYGLELYTEGRFVALTGTNAQGLASYDYSNHLPSLVDTYFPPKITTRGNEWTVEPLSEYTSFKNNEALLKKALASKSAANKFGNRASFKDLWERNADVLADMYSPDASDTGLYDESNVDMALAQHLAFWTGCNCEHILSLMWCSALVRDKWTVHKNYLTMTITRAVSLQEMVYTGGKKKEPERIPAQPMQPLNDMVGPEIVEGYQFLPATQQIEHFVGCTYIQDVHKIFTPNGSQLKSEQFNATYGGYVFQLDNNTGGKLTKKAWEAFTESQIVRYPKAESSCFRPDVATGALVTEENRKLVNTYVPITTPRKQGDVTPFLLHLAKVLPNPQDQAILLAYMAACIQHKGVKFQWAPLIQGAEGNGKTLFTRCVAFAVGKRYTHMPRASEISEKFNAWLFNKIFIGVEDIYVPDHKLEIIEVLKPMISAEDYEKRDMGVTGTMYEICCNFIFNSNHKDAVRKTRNDRRFCIFYTAQQSIEDIERDGLDGNYFPDLYHWLKADGYAIVANYLETYVIPDELNPAGTCHRAPNTSSTDEAITASMGGIEQEVLEAIDEGRSGFSGGWISSMAFERLLQILHATRRIPRNKRHDLLKSLGYEWHPALNEGRVNNAILIDGGKPRLFIKNGHLALNLKTPAEVVKAYVDAQGGAIPLSNHNAADKFR